MCLYKMSHVVDPNSNLWSHSKICLLFEITVSTVYSNCFAIVDVDEGVLDGSDISGTHLDGFLVKN